MSFAIQGLIRRRRSILSKTLTLIQHLQIEHQSENPTQFVSSESAAIKKYQVRNFVGVVKDEILVRRLRNEIEYEVDHLPEEKAADEFNGFKVDPRPGHQWIRLGKKFGDIEEDIQVEVTMFDGSAPLTEQGTKPGLPGEELQLHITIIVTIFKQPSNRLLEFVCSAWPDSLEVQNFFVRQQSTFSTTQPYTGPKFWELDDKLQEALHAFLKERGIDKSLCVFLHKLMLHKDKSEYIRWLASAQSAVESLPQIAPAPNC